MDVEARLLLYSVVLGAAVSLVQLFHRRAFAFRAYMLELAALFAVSTAALVNPPWTRAAAWPAFWAFVAVAIAPSVLIEAARRAARARRYGVAWASATTGVGLLGFPAPLHREAALYGALAAAERGDDEGCRRRLDRLARGIGIPLELGGEALVHVLPAAARRRWDEVLAALDAAPHRPPTLLAVEVRAAGDAGDLRRALRACREIDAADGVAASARAAARRSLLAAAGRAAFLEEAANRRLPVLAGPPGTAELAIARAREALGDAAGAAGAYDAARRAGRGGVRLDAVAGGRRCAEGRMLVAAVDELETAALLDLEAACRAERSAPEEVPLLRRAPFTLGVALVTLLATALVFTLVGGDTIALISTGALSPPLVVGEGEWWRLGTAVLLHASWFHLAMNLAAIVFVGLPLESRIGPSRTAIVYLGSGFLASAASTYWQALYGRTPVGVGASGAAMGLMGALCVLMLRRPALFGDAERRRWLGALGITVVATIAVGLAEREFVDNTAHAVGFLAGGLIGWLLLPGALEGTTHAAARRLGALALCGLMTDCVWIAAASMHEWRDERLVGTHGARLVAPTWLSGTKNPEGDVVLARAALPFALQFGASPALPQPDLLLPQDVRLRESFAELLAARPRRVARSAVGARSLETAEYVAATGEGFRLSTYRDGTAFVVLLRPFARRDDGEEDDEFAALAVRIGTSLTGVE